MDSRNCGYCGACARDDFAACTTFPAVPADKGDGIEGVEYIDSLIFKLECFIDHATGGKLSESSWSLETLKAAHDEHVSAVVDEMLRDAGMVASGTK